MENTQKKPLYLLEDGVDESAVKLLPILKKWLQSLMDLKVGGRKKWPLVKIRVDTCWEWLASYNLDGYGLIRVNGVRTSAHKAFYQYSISKVPKNLELDHLCRNRFCLNPTHLETITHKENCLRGNGQCARNARKTHCKRGHLLTGERNAQGFRFCKICTYALNNERRRRKRLAEKLKSMPTLKSQ